MLDLRQLRTDGETVGQATRAEPAGAQDLDGPVRQHAVRPAAVGDKHLALGQLRQPAFQLVDGNVDRANDELRVWQPSFVHRALSRRVHVGAVVREPRRVRERKLLGLGQRQLGLGPNAGGASQNDERNSREAGQNLNDGHKSLLAVVNRNDTARARARERVRLTG